MVAVPGSSCGVHPAGVGEGGSVSLGQQLGTGGRVSLTARQGLQPAGGDPQPCIL